MPKTCPRRCPRWCPRHLFYERRTAVLIIGCLSLHTFRFDSDDEDFFLFPSCSTFGGDSLLLIENMDLKVQSRVNAGCVQTLQLVEIIQLFLISWSHLRLSKTVIWRKIGKPGFCTIFNQHQKLIFDYLCTQVCNDFETCNHCTFQKLSFLLLLQQQILRF